MKTTIRREDYYEYMYDIEKLTDLNRKRKGEKDKHITEIERLIVGNACLKAQVRLRKIFCQTTKGQPAELKILNGTLWIKNRVFSSFIFPKYLQLSPKNSALEELSLYFKKQKKQLEKNMVVEKAVAEAWIKVNPNPNSEKDIDNFYISTDAYIYELMAANHIVQTLYSYYVLTQKLQKLNVASVLDYGAGAGTLSILFKNLGYAVTYADLPGKLFNYAQWRFKQRKLEIPMIDIRNDRMGEKYDCIICTEVVEHVVDPVGLIKKNEIIIKQQWNIGGFRVL